MEGQTDRQTQTDMMRLIVAFHNVANVTKNSMEIKLRNCDLCH
jgi:hypothetical protein